MRKRYKLLIGLAVVGLVVFSINLFVTARVWQHESCSTYDAYPTTLNIIKILDHNENFTGKHLCSEGWYTVCQSHPDYKAFGVTDYPCFSDNGTHVKVGSQGYYYDWTTNYTELVFYDNTWWEAKAEILGEQIYKTELLQGTEIIIVTLLALISISIAIFCIYMFSSTNSLEKSEREKA